MVGSRDNTLVSLYIWYFAFHDSIKPKWNRIEGDFALSMIGRQTGSESQPHQTKAYQDKKKTLEGRCPVGKW